VTHADLTSPGSLLNEIVVDGRGNAYVNGGTVALAAPEGSARQAADGIAFGNGMARRSTLTAAASPACSAAQRGERCS
jgi:hypothetical protein